MAVETAVNYYINITIYRKKGSFMANVDIMTPLNISAIRLNRILIIIYGII